MIILDTSFLIALFNENSPAHNRAIGEMRKYESKEKKIILNEHVFAKTVDILAREASVENAKVFIKFALENFNLQDNDPEDIEAIIEIFQNQKKNLSYCDSSLIFLSKFLGCSVATYNKNLLDEIAEYSKME